MLKPSQKAPEFELNNQSGKIIKLKDFKGKQVVLYFYPRDMTPGCTIEACEFRDYNKEIKKKNAVIFGISADDENSHKKFIQKHKLNFQLLADPSRKVCKAYKVWGKKNFMGKEFMGIKRTTFIIDKNGKIKKIFKNVKPLGHSKEVFDAL